MGQFQEQKTHKDSLMINHDLRNNINYQDQDNRVFNKQWTKQEFHELKQKPQQETLNPSRRLIHLVNRDAVFSDAKRILGLFPQVAYKLVRSSTLERARMTTAFVLSLFETEYFSVDQKGSYDPSISGNQQRARNMLLGIVYGKKPLFLSYAGKSFFKHYPELKDQEKV